MNLQHLEHNTKKILHFDPRRIAVMVWSGSATNPLKITPSLVLKVLTKIPWESRVGNRNASPKPIARSAAPFQKLQLRNLPPYRCNCPCHIKTLHAVLLLLRCCLLSHPISFCFFSSIVGCPALSTIPTTE